VSNSRRIAGGTRRSAPRQQATHRDPEIADIVRAISKKVVQNGKRADSIVKNMLLHSRQGLWGAPAGRHQRLVEESLNMAYNGARVRSRASYHVERSLTLRW